MAHSSCDHEGGIGRAALALALAIMGLASPAVSQAPSAARSGTVHALLINGGSQPASNYLSHLEHLQEMVALLQRRGVAPEHIHVFSADGDDPAADLTMRTGPPQDFWLIADTAVGKRLAPRVQLVDTSWSAVKLHPARLDDLRRWFEAARTEIPPGDQLLLFVTDHGGTARAGPGSGTISLWHEQLTVRELRSLLDRLSSRVRVVTVMSQCYSGAFADLMYDRGVDPPSGNTCGFFATSAEDKAYGCYPEGQDLKRTGYAFQFIDALGQQSAVVDAHLQVVQADAAPDKPRRTSDAYLSRLVSDEAAARGADPDELTDFLLASAWRLPARWEPEIRLLDAIGESFGTFSPRSLRELKSRERGLAEHAEQLKTYSNRWSAALTDVKESLLVGFLAAHPDWRAELEPQVVEALPADQRTSMLDRLLRELHPFAQQSTAWGKLERFREAASQAADASWRFEVRRAAAERMRTILTSVAGRELLSGTSSTAPRPTSRASQQDALSALARCEAMEPGTLSQPVTRQAARVSFPPMTDEVDLLRTLQPSWLGVRYGPVPQALRTAQPSLSGAPQVQFVEDASPVDALRAE